MNNEKRYSIRLANGKEQMFETAAEMAQWMADQRTLNRPRRKTTSQNPKRKAARKVRCYSGESPLARYANRNSDET